MDEIGYEILTKHILAYLLGLHEVNRGKVVLGYYHEANCQFLY